MPYRSLLPHLTNGLQKPALLGFALSCLLIVPRATAQTEMAAPPGYREAVAAAVQEYEARSYSEAREQFRRAHALYPNARTLRGLGITEYELHNYPEAVRYLEQALSSEVRPLGVSVRAETERLLERARGYVGTVQIQTVPSTAYIQVDNQRIEHASDPLLLPVGDHVIEASSPGRLSERRVLTVQGGQTHVVQISLLKVAQPGSTGAERMPVERPTSTPVYRRWWLWTAVAVVAGGAATAAILLTRTEKQREVATRTDNTPLGRGPLAPFAWEFDQ